MMTVRECYRRIATFKRADFIPHLDCLPGRNTIRRWYNEGLPEGVSPQDFFGFDRVNLVRQIDFGPIPGLPPKSEEMPMTRYGRAFRSRWGRIAVWHQEQDPEYAEAGHLVLRGGLTDRAEWEEIKDQFQPDTGARYPADWDEMVRGMRRQDAVHVLEAPSMVGGLRMELGFENYCVKLYEDRAMIEEIMDRQTELALAILDKALDDFEFDMLWFWEDCAFRSGPILSPAIFEEICVPRYRRLADWYLARGGEIVAVDSDGDVRELIPGWLRGGINHIWPLEPFAGMDVVALRRQYGQAFSMRGGVDKHVLARGRDAIVRELERVAPVVEEGGYVPHLDHQVPDCRFEDYCFYQEKKREILGVRSRHDRRADAARVAAAGR